MHMDINNFFNGIEVPRIRFESYHIDTTTPEPLLYQSGYLTIKDYDKEFETYTLGFPNGEVEYGFLYQLIPFYIQVQDEQLLGVKGFIKDLRSGNVDGFMKRVQAIFAAMPKKTSEKYYELDGKQVFFLIFKMLGQFIQCEVQNGDRQIAARMPPRNDNSEFSRENSRCKNDMEVIFVTDCVIWTSDIIYVFEFKLDGTADEALAQIESKNYGVAYQSDGRKVVKVGAVFSSQTCNVTEWKMAATDLQTKL